MNKALYANIGAHEHTLNQLIPLVEKVDNVEGKLSFVATSAHEAVEHIKELEQRCYCHNLASTSDYRMMAQVSSK